MDIGIYGPVFKILQAVLRRLARKAFLLKKYFTQKCCKTIDIIVSLYSRSLYSGLIPQ